ncbi:MAG: hypothetical protein ACPLVG_09260 [Pseudothermotoga sp.]
MESVSDLIFMIVLLIGAITVGIGLIFIESYADKKVKEIKDKANIKNGDEIKNDD